MRAGEEHTQGTCKSFVTLDKTCYLYATSSYSFTNKAHIQLEIKKKNKKTKNITKRKIYN